MEERATVDPRIAENRSGARTEWGIALAPMAQKAATATLLAGSSVSILWRIQLRRSCQP